MINLIWMYVAIQATYIAMSNAMYHELSMETIMRPVDVVRNESYFGYSMAYRDATKSLIVSAPRADSIGRLYTCDIDTKECQLIKNNVERKYSKYTHDYWLGATVRAGSSFVVTCAPLYVFEDYSYKEPAAGGVCYKINSETNDMETLPQIKVIERNLHTANLLQEKFDSFGWSIDVASDDTVIVGGPAMFTGRIMTYKFGKKYVATTSGKELNDIKFNFGYSVAAGNFYSKSSITYAVGTPFGSHGSGRVVFLTTKLEYLFEINVEEVGTMFGAVLCTVHLESLTALLVGAPTYAEERQYNVGAVYVYLTDTKTSDYTRKLVGFKDNSFFGSAIVSVGDLNGDKYDEIAIAAPYEDDGRGAVYLYSGAQVIRDNSPNYLQRIQSKLSRTFGLSLAVLHDFDNNGCNELAVGAPESESITVLRCMASVHVELFTVFPNLQNRRIAAKHSGNMNETHFQFKSCLRVTYPKKPTNILASISVNVNIRHQHAVLADPTNDKHYVISLVEMQPQYCRPVGVHLPEDGNYNLDIVTSITAALENDPIHLNKFESSRVRLASGSKLSIKDTISAAECNGASCEPELDVEITTSIKGENYTCGSSESEMIHFNISNTGDIAYSACMKVRITGAPVKRIFQSSCSSDSETSVITCVPKKALVRNRNWEAGNISIDTSQLTNENVKISVDVDLYGNCMTQKPVKRNLDIDLHSDYSSVIIEGNEDIANMINLTINDVKYNGKKFEHIYTVNNEGLTNLISSYKVILPKRSYIKYSDVNIHTETEMASCRIIINTTSDSDIAECNYNKLYKHRQVDVIVAMEILPGALVDIIGKEISSANTMLVMETLKKTYSYRIETQMLLQVATVPFWIYIIAALVGFLILVLIALILRELGFLRRENKEKLEKLRRSVRRQSIRQSLRAQSNLERQRGLEEEANICFIEAKNNDK